MRLCSCVFAELFESVAAQQVCAVVIKVQGYFQALLQPPSLLAPQLRFLNMIFYLLFNRPQAFFVFDWLWNLLFVSFIVFRFGVLPRTGFLLLNWLGFWDNLSFVSLLHSFAQSHDVPVEPARVYHAFVIFTIYMIPVVFEIFLAQLAIVIIGRLVFWSL